MRWTSGPPLGRNQKVGAVDSNLIIPVYVDTNALLDLLASIEGGFSLVEKVTTRTASAAGSDKQLSAEAGTEFGVPNVLSMLKIRPGGSLRSTKQQESGEETEAKRYPLRLPLAPAPRLPRRGGSRHEPEPRRGCLGGDSPIRFRRSPWERVNQRVRPKPRGWLGRTHHLHMSILIEVMSGLGLLAAGMPLPARQLRLSLDMTDHAVRSGRPRSSAFARNRGRLTSLRTIPRNLSTPMRRSAFVISELPPVCRVC